MDPDDRNTASFDCDYEEENYPESSPYTERCCYLSVGPNKRHFTVPYHFLLKCPYLVSLFKPNASRNDLGRTIRLRELDENTAHTLVHFLYTGEYEMLHRPCPSDPEKTITEYGRNFTVYQVARRYGLPSLAARAKKNIKRLDRKISVFEVLEVGQSVFENLPQDETWFCKYLRAKLQDAFVVDTSVFAQEQFLEYVGSAFTRMLVRTLVGICTDNCPDLPTKNEWTQGYNPKEQVDVGVAANGHLAIMSPDEALTSEGGPAVEEQSSIEEEPAVVEWAPAEAKPQVEEDEVRPAKDDFWVGEEARPVEPEPRAPPADVFFLSPPSKKEQKKKKKGMMAEEPVLECEPEPAPEPELEAMLEPGPICEPGPEPTDSWGAWPPTITKKKKKRKTVVEEASPPPPAHPEDPADDWGTANGKGVVYEVPHEPTPPAIEVNPAPEAESVDNWNWANWRSPVMTKKKKGKKASPVSPPSEPILDELVAPEPETADPPAKLPVPKGKKKKGKKGSVWSPPLPAEEELVPVDNDPAADEI